MKTFDLRPLVLAVTGTLLASQHADVSEDRI